MVISKKYIIFSGGPLAPGYLFDFTYDGKVFKHVYHLYFWLKAKFFNDEEMMKKIGRISRHTKIWSYGHQIAGYDKKTWDDNRYQQMVNALVIRISLDKDYYESLKSYKDREFVYANGSDGYWGNRLYEQFLDNEDPSKWKGKNMYGKALTEAMKILKEREKLEVSDVSNG